MKILEFTRRLFAILLLPVLIIIDALVFVFGVIKYHIIPEATQAAKEM